MQTSPQHTFLIANVLVSFLETWGLFLLAFGSLATSVASLVIPDQLLRFIYRNHSEILEKFEKKDLDLLVKFSGWVFLLTGIAVGAGTIMTH